MTNVGKEQEPTLIDPVALGKKVGNIINGMPEYPSVEDIRAARDAAGFVLRERLDDFDEIVDPDEVEWGLPESTDEQVLHEPNHHSPGAEWQ